MAAHLDAALEDAAREIFRADPAGLTVNAVRKQVEERLGLGDGFFKIGEWKDKSKEIIKTAAAALTEAEEGGETTKDTADEKAADEATGKKKSQKAAPVPRNTITAELPSRKRKLNRKTVADSEEDVDDGNDGDDGRHGDEGLATAKRKTSLDDSDSGSETSHVIDITPPRRRAKTAKTEKKKQPRGKPNQAAKKRKTAISDDDEEERKMDEGNGGGNDDTEKGENTKGKKKSGAIVDDSDSSLSSVLDGPPPRAKRKSGGGGTSAATAPSPSDAEIKKLQGQLVKCGVRKIWGVELKRYGSDAKAKIRHLKGMLHEVGMDGRFSEAKAREIRERRELLKDLEDVQEMNRNWGVNGGGRASRQKAAAAVKSLRETSSSEEDTGGRKEKEKNKEKKNGNQAIHDSEDDAESDTADDGRNDTAKNGAGDSGSDDVEGQTWTKGRASSRYKTELAFLGSDSESDE